MLSDSEFEKELKKRIEEEITRLTHNIVAGLAMPDYAEYRYNIGKIAGLRLVTDSYCDEIATAINKKR